jgi:hypothetical protein
VAQRWIEQEPYAVVGLVAVLATTVLLLVFKAPWVALGIFSIIVVTLVGVKVKQWTHPLRQDEVAVVSGRFGGAIKVVMSGRMFLRPGEISTKLSLRWQQVRFRVECRSGDEVPMTFSLHSAFRIPRNEAAILTVAEKFGDDEAAMQQQVSACLVGHVRDVVGACAADEADRATGEIAEEAMRRARENLAGLGFESEQLTVEGVELSDEWRATLTNRAAKRAEIGAVEAELEIEDRVNRARIARETQSRLADEKAKADANYYTQMRQVELERVHMQLADDRRELERRHERAMAELEVYRLKETLGVQSAYHDVNIQRMIVEQLPQILEAKGKLLPNLRTYIAGPHDNGLAGLLTGLADFGPDIVKELGSLFSSVVSGERDQLPETAEQRPQIPRSPSTQDDVQHRPGGASSG